MSQCLCHSQDQIKFQAFMCLAKVSIKAPPIQAGTGLSIDVIHDSWYINWYLIYACNLVEGAAYCLFSP